MHTKLRPLFFTLVSTLLLWNCSGSNEPAAPVTFTDAQKQTITKYAADLIKSIHAYNFDLMNASWDEEGFKDRIIWELTTTENSVFQTAYDQKLRLQFKLENLRIFHRVNQEEGKVYQLGLTFFDQHAELVLLAVFPTNHVIRRYRIELHGNKPAITDWYNYANDMWTSEAMKELARLNNEYRAGSNERYLANRSLQAAMQAWSGGNSELALQQLNSIPESHVNSYISLSKINVAYDLGLDQWYQTLNEEYQKQPSLYIQYLRQYHLGDSTELAGVYQTLQKALGKSPMMDSVRLSGSYWMAELFERKVEPTE